MRCRPTWEQVGMAALAAGWLLFAVLALLLAPAAAWDWRHHQR